MADRLTRHLPYAMAGIAPVTHNIRACVVRVGIQEAGRGMAVTTLGAGDRVGTGRDFIFSWRHANRHRTVMTTAACPANIRMIKAAVRI